MAINYNSKAILEVVRSCPEISKTVGQHLSNDPDFRSWIQAKIEKECRKMLSTTGDALRAAINQNDPLDALRKRVEAFELT